MKRWMLHKGLPFFLMFVMIFSLSTATFAAATDIETDREAVYYYLKNYHINGANLVKSSINEMIESLNDPYTEYFTQEEFEAFMNQIDGTLVGIGIYLENKEDAVIVLAPMKNSPAANAGILPGDRIIAVDDLSVIGKSMNEIANLVRGKEGTTVKLTVQRVEQQLTFNITRAKIELPLVEYEILAEEGIGYVHLNSFGDHTYPELVSALQEFEAAGIDRIILDLRGNSGGKVDSVLKIASLFIGEGPIMWIKDGASEEESLNTYGSSWWNTPMVLLTDRGSASASEILAGALQDYHLTTVIGDTTFGKGVMQSLVTLPSGSELKLTTNEFFSPRKNKINTIGIKPDVRIETGEDVLTYAKQWIKNAAALRNGEKVAITLHAKSIDKLDSWVLQNKDGWYIALYRLHGMIGGDLVWDQASRTTTYTINGVKQAFKVGFDPMIIKDGHIYAPIDSLKGIPNLSITKDQAGNIMIKR